MSIRGHRRRPLIGSADEARCGYEAVFEDAWRAEAAARFLTNYGFREATSPNGNRFARVYGPCRQREFVRTSLFSRGGSGFRWWYS